MSRLTRDGTVEPVSRETKFSDANGAREIFIFPVQLTTRRIGNLTRLIFTLAICDGHAYIHTNIHTYMSEFPTMPLKVDALKLWTVSSAKARANSPHEPLGNSTNVHGWPA